MKPQFLVVILIIMLLVLSGVGAGSKPRPTGFFSDMHYVGDTGDVVGTEVFILYSTDGLQGQYYALVQQAEGVPEPPVLTKVAVAGERVEFTVPESTGKLVTFKGRVTSDALVGAFDGSQDVLRLRRGNSYWQ